MHRLPGCYKSFYNKLHKALWCLNIYGCLNFPWGLFSVKVATALSQLEWLQTSYREVRVKGLMVLTRRRPHIVERPLMSAVSSIMPSNRHPLLVDSIDLANKHGATWPLLIRQTNKQTSPCQNYQAGLCWGPQGSQYWTNMLEISKDKRQEQTWKGCNPTWLLNDSWIMRSTAIIIAVHAVRVWIWDGWKVSTGILMVDPIGGCLLETCHFNHSNVLVSCQTRWLFKRSVPKTAAVGLMSPQASS